MNWLKQLFSRRRIYRELSEEIREHLEEKTEELVAAGCREKKQRCRAAGVWKREFDGRE